MLTLVINIMKIQKFIVAFVAAVTLLNPIVSFAQGWVIFDLTVLDENTADGYYLQEPEIISFNDVAGYAWGDGGTMYKTFDGGRSWIGASNDGVGNTWIGFDTQFAVNRLYALDGSDVMIVSSGKNVYKSDDYAFSFDSEYLDYMESDSANWLWGSSQISDQEYLFINGSRLYKTYDTFETAEVIYESNELNGREFYCDMAASDSGKSVIIEICSGEEGIIVSDDYGESFTRVDIDFSLGVNGQCDFDFASDDVVYIGRGGLYKSIDGGLNWELMPEPEDTIGVGSQISFLDEDNGVVLAWSRKFGSDGDYDFDERIYFTADGGYTWTLMNNLFPDGYDLWIRDLYYYNQDMIFASAYCNYGTDYELKGACMLRYNTSKGVLIKSEDSPNVYYAGSDGLLHWIPSEEIFYTWYDDFSSVETVPQDYVDSMKLGYDAVARVIGNQEDIETTTNW